MVSSACVGRARGGRADSSCRCQRAVDVEEADCVLDGTLREGRDDAADLCHGW